MMWSDEEARVGRILVFVAIFAITFVIVYNYFLEISYDPLYAPTFGTQFGLVLGSILAAIMAGLAGALLLEGIYSSLETPLSWLTISCILVILVSIGAYVMGIFLLPLYAGILLLVIPAVLRSLYTSWSIKGRDLVWSHERGDLILRVSNETSPKIRDFKNFVVRGEFEKATIFRHGKYQVLQAGKYSVKDVDEVIYVDTSPQRNLKFGIPFDRGLVSKDKQKFGVHGVATLRIKGTEADIAKFVNEVVAGQNSLTCRDLMDWLQEGPLSAVLRDIIKRATYEEFRSTDREDIMRAIQAKLGAELATYGLELIDIDVRPGPPRK